MCSSDLGAVANEHRLAAPFDRDDLAFLDRIDVDLNGRQGQRRGIRIHLVDQRPGDRANSHRGDRAGGQEQKISAVLIDGGRA